MIVFDDGFGPALYAAGSFYDPHVGTAYLGKWSGTEWQSLGDGPVGGFEPVVALAVFDDGTGSALYAGGDITYAGGIEMRGVFKWNGKTWSHVGDGLRSVGALAVFDDGHGPALYASARMSSNFKLTIVKWTGTSWESLVEAETMGFGAMTVFDDGTGPSLFVASSRTNVGGVSVRNIAKWDGAAWSSVGEGPLNGTNGQIRCLYSFDDGSGPALYVGGDFTEAGGFSGNRIAKWNGNAWSALGSGMDDRVNSLCSHDDGTGPALYAAGTFVAANGNTVRRIAKWNGSDWLSLQSGLNASALSLCEYNDGTGPALFVAGNFYYAGGVYTAHMARWRHSKWSRLGSGVEYGPYDFGGIIYSLKRFDDGQGPALYAGGDFLWAGGLRVNHIARWDGEAWSSLVGGLSEEHSVAYAVETFDDGSGSALYVGGDFESAGGISANSIARWDGTTWTPLSSGVTGLGNEVRSLAVYDDGTGRALYVGGSFAFAGGLAADKIARWDGNAWSAVGEGFQGDNQGNDEFQGVRALVIHDDGTGSALYAAGNFNSSGATPILDIAKWKDETWTPVGGGIPGDYAEVWALAVFDDGDGPALYAGGFFTQAGNAAVNSLARWKDGEWSDVGGGVQYSGWDFGIVTALSVFDDGNGLALYVVGLFDSAGPLATHNIAKWDGAEWSVLEGGIGGDEYSNPVYAMTEFPDSLGPALYVGGFFSRAGDKESLGIAKWSLHGPKPVITRHPVTQIVCAGEPTSLSVKVTGRQPLGYRWRKNGVLMEGEDHRHVHFGRVVRTDAARYDVTVMGPCGETQSYDAFLYVLSSNTGDGDLNDTSDGADLQRFVDSILNRGPMTRGYCAYDMNDDGAVDASDVPLFVDRLLIQ
ncbi:MAG TPA: immunoglobulin domain-containing protein [Phycisphaerae bacterium]|nr:immunoglobulin domain-containing protein [Phycisphaerae bacterium]